MKLKLESGTIYIKDADITQYTVIKGWGRLKWSRKTGLFSGPATLEVLDRLAKLVRLPESVEAERARMRSIANAVDRVRMDPEPEPFIATPVKVKPFLHQIRAYNMALLTFGFAQPADVQGGTT